MDASSRSGSPAAEATERLRGSGLIGLDEDRMAAWMQSSVPSVTHPVTFHRLTGGRSNLTFRAFDDVGRSLIVRRPPTGPIQPSAHDVIREATILRALQTTDVPVPTVVAVEDSGEVVGAPFYVMSDVPGHILRTHADTERLTPEERRAVSVSVITTLAAMHSLPVTSGELAHLGRHDGFMQRQLRRFGAQLQTVQTRDLPWARTLHVSLSKRLPRQQRTSLVHGDYRLDNIILDAGWDVAAVLDWELSTLGDPLADLAMLQVYWHRPGLPEIPTLSSPTDLPGFLDHDDLLTAYGRETGLDLSELPIYRAFALWRLAIILDGVYVRYTQGAYDGDDEGNYTELGKAAPLLLERAAALLDL